MKCNNKCINAFTLLEVIICVAIISIMTSYIYLSTSNLSKNSLKVDAVHIKSFINQARLNSITSGTPYYVNFDIDNNCIELVKSARTSVKVIDTYYLNKKNKITKINQSDNKVYFTSEGATSSACTITISNSKYLQDITVNIGAGKVTILDPSKY